jgi:outer membrane protein assembly factor BamB
VISTIKIMRVLAGGRRLSIPAVAAVMACLAAGIVGCGAFKGFGHVAEPALGGEGCSVGISADLLDKAGLRSKWTLGQAGMEVGIKRIFYHNGRLLVLDKQNNLHSLNGSNGLTVWSVKLAESYPSCSEPEYYKDRMLFVIGNSIVELREKDGEITNRIALGFPASTTAARSEDYVFVGSTNGRFYCLRLRDKIVFWSSAQVNEPIGRVRVSNDKVYFTGKGGAVYVSSVGHRELLWSASTAGMTPGPVIVDDKCYLASSDTGLYCFAADTGQGLWKYLAGGALVDVPVVTKRFVYQPVEQKSLLCLERNPGGNNGTLRWELANGQCLLAENGDVSYAMTYGSELAVMDNIAGQRKLSFYVPGMNLCASNDEDTTIFLASDKGEIMAIVPK